MENRRSSDEREFPRWIDGPPKYEYFSFIGDNEDGYASEYMTIKANALTPIPMIGLARSLLHYLAQDSLLGEQ